MKGLYITLINLLQPGNLGLTKVKGQINAFKNLGCEMDWIYEKETTIFLNDEIIGKRELSYKGVNQFFLKIRDYLKQDRIKYDFIYIRYMPSNIGLLYLIKYLKKQNIKVFLEIPTYPYYPEMPSGIKTTIYKNIDKFITGTLKNYVHRIVLTTDKDKVFGIDTITINNAIDLDIIKLNKKEKHSNFNLMGLANIQDWHGYDKVIEGLHKYYESKKCSDIVKFYIVGGGNEKIINQLKSNVKLYHLEDYVIFCGPRVGNELDEIYSIMDIGISSLALDRAGGGHNPVKTKEFLGKGLPVIIGYSDKQLDSSIPFVFNISTTNSKIEIPEILAWYKNLKVTETDIREFASKKLSWEKEMSKVIECLKGSKE